MTTSLQELGLDETISQANLCDRNVFPWTYPCYNYFLWLGIFARSYQALYNFKKGLGDEAKLTQSQFKVQSMNA